MHPNPRRIIPVVLFLALAGAAAWWYYGGGRASADNGAISASGTIEATQINIAPELGGRVEAVHVSEGDVVKAGDVLVQFDTALLEAQRAQAAAALAAAKANYDVLQAGPATAQGQAQIAKAEKDVLDAQQALDKLIENADLATAQAQWDVANAQDKLDAAQRHLRGVKNPDVEFYRERVTDAQNALLTAQQNAQIIDIGSLGVALHAARDVLDLAGERLDKVKAAIEGCPECDPKRQVTVDRIPLTLEDAQEAYNDTLNRVHELELQIDQAKRANSTALDNAQEKLDDAEADLASTEKGSDAIDLALAEAGVAAAEAKLADARKHYAEVQNGPDPDDLAAVQARLAAAQAALTAAQAGASPQQLAAAQAQVDAAQAALDTLDVQIGKLKLIAPADGVVLSRAIEPGEVASPGATLLVIGNLSDLTITVYVPEDRYGNISLGQTAQVSVDSSPGQKFTATVMHIADQAEFTPRNVQTADGRKTTVFAVRLSVNNADGKLKPGMPADVKFGN